MPETCSILERKEMQQIKKFGLNQNLSYRQEILRWAKMLRLF